MFPAKTQGLRPLSQKLNTHNIMPADLTKDTKKTNYMYLRDSIKDNEEAIEFLEAFDKEMKTIIEDKDETIRNLELELDDATVEKRAFSNQIETGMEPLNWDCDNIAIQSMMEELGEALGRSKTPLNIENILRAI
jgi:hypothetical protein